MMNSSPWMQIAPCYRSRRSWKPFSGALVIRPPHEDRTRPSVTVGESDQPREDVTAPVPPSGLPQSGVNRNLTYIEKPASNSLMQCSRPPRVDLRGVTNFVPPTGTLTKPSLTATVQQLPTYIAELDGIEGGRTHGGPGHVQRRKQWLVPQTISHENQEPARMLRW